MHLEIEWQANSENDDIDTQTIDSKHTWRRSGKHTRRKTGKQLEMISGPSTGRMWSVPTSTPTWRMINATVQHRRDDEKSNEFDQCWTSANMATEAVPNETENDLSTYQIVYRTASWETVTECHCETVEITTKRWLPDCLEWRAQELSIIGSSTYRRHLLGCLPNRLLKGMPHDYTGGL